MTTEQMEKIDEQLEPLERRAYELIDSIEKKLPQPGVTEYKRSPLRVMKKVIRKLEEIVDDMLVGLVK